MKRDRIVAPVIGISFFLLLSPTALFAQKTVKATVPASEPQKAALAWLSLVGAGKYAASYDAAAKTFQKQVTKSQWEDDMKNVVSQTGSFRSRTLLKGQRMTTLPGMPPGNYAILQYKSVFETMPNGIETVVLEQEADKKWRVNGYLVKPAPQL